MNSHIRGWLISILHGESNGPKLITIGEDGEPFAVPASRGDTSSDVSTHNIEAQLTCICTSNPNQLVNLHIFQIHTSTNSTPGARAPPPPIARARLALADAARLLRPRDACRRRRSPYRARAHCTSSACSLASCHAARAADSSEPPLSRSSAVRHSTAAATLAPHALPPSAPGAASHTRAQRVRIRARPRLEMYYRRGNRGNHADNGNVARGDGRR